MKAYHVLALLVAICAGPALSCPPPSGAVDLFGPEKVGPYQLAKVAMRAHDKGAAKVVGWNITPAPTDKVEMGNRLVFIGRPGKYTVEAVVSVVVKGETTIERPTWTVTIEGEEAAPAPKPNPDPGKPDPVKATALMTMAKGRCTATIIGPEKVNGQHLALSAAHCLEKVGELVTLKLRDGRTYQAKVSVIDRPADLAWLVVLTTDALPYAVLARADPSPGTSVWHNGYGTDKPSNVEIGERTLSITKTGQLSFDLSVSPGDSGGGIFRRDNGQLVAVVCCTSSMGKKAPMYGGAATRARALRPLPSLWVHPIALAPGIPSPLIAPKALLALPGRVVD